MDHSMHHMEMDHGGMDHGGHGGHGDMDMGSKCNMNVSLDIALLVDTCSTDNPCFVYRCSLPGPRKIYASCSLDGTSQGQPL